MSFIVHPGQVMSEYLDERGYTEDDLAEAAGLSIDEVVDYLNGDGEFSLNLALGMNELMDGDPNTNYWVNYHQEYINQ